VPTDQRNAQVGDGRMEFGEQAANIRVGRADRQQHGGQEPAGADSHDGHVVGVYCNRRPADALAGERDRVGGDHEAPGRDIDDRGVFAQRRAQPNLGGQRGTTGEHVTEEHRRQLAALEHGLVGVTPL
jgi:hypothetical protein